LGPRSNKTGLSISDPGGGEYGAKQVASRTPAPVTHSKKTYTAEAQGKALG
jgi:hypothetical protein